MENRVKETYTKEGKKIQELIQEWIDENNNFLYCQNKKIEK